MNDPNTMYRFFLVDFPSANNFHHINIFSVNAEFGMLMSGNLDPIKRKTQLLCIFIKTSIVINNRYFSYYLSNLNNRKIFYYIAKHL